MFGKQLPLWKTNHRKSHSLGPPQVLTRKASVLSGSPGSLSRIPSDCIPMTGRRTGMTKSMMRTRMRRTRRTKRSLENQRSLPE